MKWTVRWRRSARNDLALLWANASDRANITAAANSIDSQLENNPLNAGEARDKDRRIVIEPPLAVICKVKAADRKVIVTRVWRV
jgi:hypothetical protein